MGGGVASAVRSVTGEDGNTFHTQVSHAPLYCNHDNHSYTQVVEEVELATRLHDNAEALLLASVSNAPLQSLLLALNKSLGNLLVSCTAVRDSEALVNSTVGVACENVTLLTGGALYPRIHGNVDIVRSVARELEEVLSIPTLTDNYDNYLNTSLVSWYT